MSQGSRGGVPAAATAPTVQPDVPAVDACPISPLIDVVLSHWATRILWVLQHHGPQCSNEIRRRLGTVTPRLLTQRLRQLERDGLVQRTCVVAVPPRGEHAITDLGLSLSPTSRTLATWAGAHMPAVEAARDHHDTTGRPRPA